MMRNLLKNTLWKILCCLILVIGLGINNATAYNNYLNTTARNCQNIDRMKSYLENLKNLYISDVPQKQAIIKQRNVVIQKYTNLIKTCESAMKAFPSAMKALSVKEEHWYGDTKYTDEEYSQKFKELLQNMSTKADNEKSKKYAQTLLNDFNSFNNTLDQEYLKLLDDYKATGGPRCGNRNPFGCPPGQKCWFVESTQSGSTATGNAGTTEHDSYQCSDEDPSSFWLNIHAQVVETSGDAGDTYIHAGMGTLEKVSYDADGARDSSLNVMGKDFQDKHTDAIGNSIDYLRTNYKCHIDELKDKYLGTCYSCVVVSALISTFMNVASTVEPLMQTAGVKLLLIGMMIWLPIYILGKLSSFVSLEPMKMLQELFTFFFKCLLAYTLITSGIKTFSTLIVNPLLIAGADYGITIIDTVMPEKLNIDGVTEDNRAYKIAMSNSIDRKVFDKIMTISKKADAAVSLNLVIGDALFCHSSHAGAISFKIPITETTSIPFYFPDFWLMLCGAVIYFFAVMVVMAINFYLLDLSFKIGFALMALPVTLGLWPFNKFKNKFVDCIKIIVNAAGTFMFLGITTGITIVLISSALGGTDELLKQINANNQQYVSRLFSLTGSSFLLILFAFFYSHNLISETVSKMADKFFNSVMSGLSPMHEMTTQTIDFAKKQIGNAASFVLKGGVGGMMARHAKDMATNAVRGAFDKMRGLDSESDGGGYSEE